MFSPSTWNYVGFFFFVCVSKAFLCRQLTGALLEPNICDSHSCFIAGWNTWPRKYTQTFIWKIRSASTHGGLVEGLAVLWVWTRALWMCLTNAVSKNNTQGHLRTFRTQIWNLWVFCFFSLSHNSHCVAQKHSTAIPTNVCIAMQVCKRPPAMCEIPHLVVGKQIKL